MWEIDTEEFIMRRGKLREMDIFLGDYLPVKQFIRWARRAPFLKNTLQPYAKLCCRTIHKK